MNLLKKPWEVSENFSFLSIHFLSDLNNFLSCVYDLRSGGKFLPE